jgi:hypothetical protein
MRQIARLDGHRSASGREIVSVEPDVKGATRDVDSFHVTDRTGETLCQRDAAGLHPDQNDVPRPAVLLDDLVRDAQDRAPDVVGRHCYPVRQNETPYPFDRRPC